jgi:hypothetical protein
MSGDSVDNAPQPIVAGAGVKRHGDQVAHEACPDDLCHHRSVPGPDDDPCLPGQAIQPALAAAGQFITRQDGFLEMEHVYHSSAS